MPYLCNVPQATNPSLRISLRGDQRLSKIAGKLLIFGRKVITSEMAYLRRLRAP
jgi:hypothetical protein